MNEHSKRVYRASATALMENALFIEDLLQNEEFINKIGDLDANVLADLNNILGYLYFILESISDGERPIFEFSDAMRRLAMLGNHVHIMDADDKLN